MNRSPRPVRIVAGAAACIALFLVLLGAWRPPSNEPAPEPGRGVGVIGPDVTVFDLTGARNWGATGDVRAYSVGTTSCNIGDEPLNWCDEEGLPCESNEHPVIAQNLYRLKDGRFEQIGMSWLKHGFFSVNTSNAECGNGSCVEPPLEEHQLGVGCTDPYGSFLNGSRPLGPRSEVNATSGDFPFPFSQFGSPATIDQRIQVPEAELDPALNPGARYFIEGQYVAPDDASVGNGLNNASYREVSVSAGSFNLNTVGPTQRTLPAIEAWRAIDPLVELAAADTSPGNRDTERFHVARRTSDTEGATWHYEYVVHNLNSHRSARGFTVALPPDTTFSGAGFSGVAHHSGEPYATADWAVVIDSPAGTITWQTDDFATDPDANALRWGTMFSFWFDADAPPAAASESIELFRPGVPATLELTLSGALFVDGFESGDTSGWTSVVQ